MTKDLYYGKNKKSSNKILQKVIHKIIKKDIEKIIFVDLKNTKIIYFTIDKLKLVELEKCSI
tara:strand:+ start:1858 stop:2043 length:186 start_codon:yes stop_codon:yes gene_type:complete